MLKLPATVQSEYPFTPRRERIGGHEISYLDEGAGPTLLFVHGNPTWSFAWRKLIEPLRSSARCVAVDHLGMGLSDKPQGPHYRLRAHVERLAELVERLDLRDVTLVGHDWGGCIGMGAATHAPDRYARFVMMNTAAFRSQRIPFRIAVCRWPIVGPAAVRGGNLFSRAALTMATAKGLSPTARAGYLAPYNSWANRIAVQRFVEDIPLSPDHPSYAELSRIEDGLAQFSGRPWMLCWGEQDWCFDLSFLEEWRRRFPDAQTHRFPDAGHYIFEDAAERLTPLLREFAVKHQR